jgi:hypothetical protein
MCPSFFFSERRILESSFRFLLFCLFYLFIFFVSNRIINFLKIVVHLKNKKCFIILFEKFNNLIFFFVCLFGICLATISIGGIGDGAGNNAFPLLSALARPAGQPPSTTGSANSPFGGLISNIFNQALSNFGRPAAGASSNINSGSNVGTTGNWNSFFTSTDPGKQQLLINSNSIATVATPSFSGLPGW